VAQQQTAGIAEQPLARPPSTRHGYNLGTILRQSLKPLILLGV
jgi:hypothetical protein